ncbi:related to alcohol dehydrogenase [Ramularia collo-cygni]|uniref:Related to alcohol dehydrogenase n=1 Tax=Ramularia collo-cygni TaxID=112498 RepID=A0A2D3UXS9_9PEZI|nr:related to alcohol dehydrogenase [Ramularia collo-cygni]CZT20238.1 related to alcohol dehydrogenase [Ramularia collo-cygni]
MTEMMHAWRMSIGKTPPIFRSRIPIPTPGPNTVLVKLHAMGVCHSDCAIRDMQEIPPFWREEFTLGHEGAGEIVALGDNVTSLAVGDHVAVHPVTGCKSEKCVHCAHGWEQACKAEDNGNHGLGQDGFFAEYVVCRADAAVVIPKGVKIQQAAVSPDALLTAYHAVKYTAGVTPKDTILIMGLGGLGLNGLQVAQHLGAKRVLVCDREQGAVDVAVRLGVAKEDAFCTADPDDKPVHAVLEERGIVVDIVVDFVGHEQTVLGAQLAVRPAGLVVLVGLLSPTVTVIPGIIVTNVLTLKGSFCGTVDGLRECLDLVGRGIVKPELVEGSINDLPQVLKKLDDGKVRGRQVLMPDWLNEGET